MNHRVFAALLVSLLLSACAGAPPRFQDVQPAAAAATPRVLARAAALDVTNHTVKHVDADKNVLYTQNFGGSMGVGLLFGPLGVMANIKMIESNTDKDVAALRDKIDLQPRALFAAAAQQRSYPVSQAGVGVKLTPYVYIVKNEDDKLMIAAAMIVEHGDTAATWSGKYMIELAPSYTVDELAALDAAGKRSLQDSVAQGFATLIAHMQAEKQDSLAQEKPIVFKSVFVTPRFVFDLHGGLIADEPELVWVRTPMGVFAVRKPHITYTAKAS